MSSEQKKRNLKIMWYITLIAGIAIKSMMDKEDEKEREAKKQKKLAKSPAKAKH
ncbi:MAG: hypothetical protein MR008_02530 [Aerococcus sp.]|nr:hypothetical protein [Aerococcus sp.]